MKLKQIALVLATSIFSFNNIHAFAQEAPKVLKTEFNDEALSQMVYTPYGDSLSMKAVLKKHKKNVLVLDLWAGWCKDCIAVMSENKIVKEKFPKVKWLYLSLDRSDTAWHKAMTKHNLNQESNYWLKAGWKNKFTNYIDLNWIPRYMVIDKKSKIKAYYIVDPKDPAFLELLQKLSK